MHFFPSEAFILTAVVVLLKFKGIIDKYSCAEKPV